MKKVKLALVGCGFISDIHKTTFESLKDKVEVVGTCDTDLQKAQNMAEMLNAPMAVADYKELIGKVDAVLIALPHHLHYPIGKDFLMNGIHVLMEKPLALDENECKELIALSEQHNVKLMVAYMCRWHPQIVELKKIIDEKRYGELFQMSIWTEQYTYAPEGSWLRSAKKLGGGQLFSHGCHYVDLLLWFLGKPVRGAHLGTNFCTPWMEMEGTSNLIMEFEGGRLAYHFGTWGAKGTRHSYAIHTFFEDAMVECCLNEGKIFLHKSTNPGNYFEKSDVEEVIFECDLASHQPKYEIEHFVDCILNDTQPLTDARSALKGQQVIWELYKAEKENRVADLRGYGFDE